MTGYRNFRFLSYPTALPVSGPGSAAFYPARRGLNPDAIEIRQLVAMAVAPFTAKLSLIRDGRTISLQNGPIHHNLMFGTAKLPFHLPCDNPIVLKQGDGIIADLNNLSSALANSVKLAAPGQDWSGAGAAAEAGIPEHAEPDVPLAVPYWLTLDAAPAVVSGGATLSPDVYMTIPDNLRFRPLALLSESTGRYQAKIHQSSDRLLTFDAEIDSDLLVGTGALPADMFGDLVLEGGEQLRWTFIDVSGAANTIYPAVFGLAEPKGGAWR